MHITFNFDALYAIGFFSNILLLILIGLIKIKNENDKIRKSEKNIKNYKNDIILLEQNLENLKKSSSEELHRLMEKESYDYGHRYSETIKRVRGNLTNNNIKGMSKKIRMRFAKLKNDQLLDFFHKFGRHVIDEKIENLESQLKTKKDLMMEDMQCLKSLRKEKIDTISIDGKIPGCYFCMNKIVVDEEHNNITYYENEIKKYIGMCNMIIKFEDKDYCPIEPTQLLKGKRLFPGSLTETEFSEDEISDVEMNVEGGVNINNEVLSYYLNYVNKSDDYKPSVSRKKIPGSIEPIESSDDEVITRKQKRSIRKKSNKIRRDFSKNEENIIRENISKKLNLYQELQNNDFLPGDFYDSDRSIKSPTKTILVEVIDSEKEKTSTDYKDAESQFNVEGDDVMKRNMEMFEKYQKQKEEMINKNKDVLENVSVHDESESDCSPAINIRRFPGQPLKVIDNVFYQLTDLDDTDIDEDRARELFEAEKSKKRLERREKIDKKFKRLLDYHFNKVGKIELIVKHQLFLLDSLRLSINRLNAGKVVYGVESDEDKDRMVLMNALKLMYNKIRVDARIYKNEALNYGNEFLDVASFLTLCKLIAIMESLPDDIHNEDLLDAFIKPSNLDSCAETTQEEDNNDMFGDDEPVTIKNNSKFKENLRCINFALKNNAYKIDSDDD